MKRQLPYTKYKNKGTKKELQITIKSIHAYKAFINRLNTKLSPLPEGIFFYDLVIYGRTRWNV